MDKINELKELKELIESLNQEKLDNEKTIEEIKNEEENSISEIDKNIKVLKQAKCNLICSIAFKIMLPIVLILFSVTTYSVYVSESLLNTIHCLIIGLLYCGLLASCSYAFKINFKKLSGCSSIKEINNQIEEKEKQKELIKSKSETNKEILVEKEQRQMELDEEIKKCATELSKYEAVKDDIVNEFLNSHEFLQKLNNRMLESEEIVKEERGTQKTLK